MLRKPSEALKSKNKAESAMIKLNNFFYINIYKFYFFEKTGGYTTPIQNNEIKNTF